MKELEIFWHTMAEGLKLLAKGVETIAHQIEGFSQAGSKAPAKSAAPKPPKAAKPKTTSRKPAAAKAQTKTAIDTVFDIIAGSTDGVNTAELVKQTGFNTKKVQNIIYKLKKRGKITTRVKGVYVKA